MSKRCIYNFFDIYLQNEESLKQNFLYYELIINFSHNLFIKIIDKMARRNEDFDEFCNPDNPRTIKHNEVLEAADRIRPYIIKTPCIVAKHQKDLVTNLYYKLEFLQKTGSFKERGSLNVLHLLSPDKKKNGVVMASIGNDAAGICYYASKLNIPVIVVMSKLVPLIKMQECQSLGAQVILQGSNLMEAQTHARSVAREKGATYINGRDHPDILSGYGTLALEILEQIPNVDAIIVPVGSGGLIAAIATTVKHSKPSCLIYGVQPEATPVFFKSLEMGSVATVPMEATLAESITVSSPGVNAFHNAKSLVDKMLLVNEDWIARAMLHLVEKEKYIVEGAGACTLAAIIGNLVPELKSKHVVCILSGGNAAAMTFNRCMDRGLTVEGRLIKFKVGIPDSPAAKAKLFKLIADGGFNMVYQFHDRIWVENEVYNVEIRLVCEAKDVENGMKLKGIIEEAYPDTSVFETEPYNDNGTCPCYVGN